MKTIDAAVIQKCFLAGANALDAKKEFINDLNVFPVPDGDTGTNMTMTIMSAAREVAAIQDVDARKLCKAISSGSLRGARGNSGVILSQLLRGFTKEVSAAGEVNVEVLANSFERAVESAYRAVMKPKEGTILTVARAGSEKALEQAERTDNLIEFMNAVIQHMRDVLDLTPEMLPVLKEAGVVDSGGEGLLVFLEGAYDALLGKEIDYGIEPDKTRAAMMDYGRVSDSGNAMGVEGVPGADIKYGYCTEFIIMLGQDLDTGEKREWETAEDRTSNHADDSPAGHTDNSSKGHERRDFDHSEEKAFKKYLSSIGDSIVCVADDDIVKVHVHTNDPGLAIQKALAYGSLSHMKIDNMREEHNERVIRGAERKAAEQRDAEERAMERREAALEPIRYDAAGSVPVERKTSMVADPTKNMSRDVEAHRQTAWGTGTDGDAARRQQPDVDGTERTARPASHKENGFVSVSVGDGLSGIFRELGVDVVIEGGQTMNPSTEDILGAIDKIDADNIYVLPNNSNIVLAAEQARELTEDKNVVVVPTKNIPQGIAAMIGFMEGASPDENREAMTEALATVKSGQVTYAVRDTTIDGKMIKAGDIMGLSDKTIETVGSDVVDTTVDLLKKMLDEESELVTIYYGEEGTEEDAGRIAAAMAELAPHAEVEVQYGGQPIYYYFVSVE